MTAQKKREILTGGIAALLIVCAVAARVVTRGHREAPYFLPVSLLRSLIYIGLMTWWGVSLWQRIVQTQVRRYLAATAALCVFWLSIRTVKFFIAATPAAIRYLWYGYYVPMLFIPLLCVLVALSLGRPENYRLPKWTNLLYLPTALLLLQVLTNDLHQLVFVFPTDAAAWLDTDHGYGVGNFIVMGWIALGMVTAIITMLLKCRIPHTKIALGLPFVPVALAALYSVLYISRIPWIELLAGDMTVVQCLLLAAGIESCIRCGLIQSNTGYRALFEASTIRAEITDEARQAVYAFIPNIIIRKTKPLGYYGRLHKAYLEMHRPILFNELVLSDKLFEHCAEIDEAARNRMELIVRSLAEQNGVTEQLKAENQMEWVRQMNACKAQAEEVVKAELIYD